MIALLVALFLAAADCGPATESYKDQYCTDPRTMRKHVAYSEWADAYSCTRHRCQPGGRNLAIYTVGCKRVEAPESAIECEEVVEDTNMQFPFCCTRLRCLVVVRGEVWTRVLGQPWETLPAAPWSHMYKMKKPPPADGTFAPKTADQGPIYELTDSESHGPHDKVLRASKEGSTAHEAKPTALPAPDIVIALSTNSEQKELNSRVPPEVAKGSSHWWSGLQGEEPHNTRRGNEHKRNYKEVPRAIDFSDDDNERVAERERDRSRDHQDTDGGDTEDTAQHHQSWTEIPQSQWNEQDPGTETDGNKEISEHKTESGAKPSNLQSLVDAIGSRMRDIESVVQRMSEKVQQPGDFEPTEKRSPEDEVRYKRHKGDTKEYGKTKRPGTDDHYKRFSVRNRGSKYLHMTDGSTEPPLFVEDSHMSGYFSDASNSLLRRSASPKEPVPTYMAPVETRRKTARTDTSEEKKRKNHHHKKKGKHHKKHHNKKKFNRLSSADVEKNAVSLEDSNAAVL